MGAEHDPVSNRCKAKTNAGPRCKLSAGDNGLCGTHRDWQDNGKQRPYKFDAIKRTAYLERLEHGVGRGAAAAGVGLTRQTVAVHRRAHEGFAIQESLAEMEAVSAVENALYEKAVTEGHPTAMIFFLKNRSPDRWKDMKTVEVVDQLRAQERGSLFRALDAAGLNDEQLEAFQTAYESNDAGNVVH